MKNFQISFVLILALLFHLGLYGQDSNKLLSCCGNSDSEARCTGSAYCSACRNCSRCAYCNSGGSCGVCSGGSSSEKRSSKNSGKSYYNNNYNSNESSRKSQSSSYSEPPVNLKSEEVPDNIFSEYYNKTLVINAEEVNLRSGPGTNYSVIQKLSYMQEVIFLAMPNDWVKVRVKSNDKIGYILMKYVLVKD